MKPIAIIFDLETTCQDKEIDANFDKELLEIGAVKVDETGNVLETFDLIVIPTRTTITPYCIELTSITKELVDQEGISFKEAMNSFKIFCEDLPLFSWGFFDKKQLIKDCIVNQYPLNGFLTNHRSLRHEHVDVYGLKNRVEIKPALKMLDLPFEGTLHRGIDDAINIATIFKHMLKNPKFKL